ncbi:hypothetical protein ACFZAV_27660 [Streptomyces sp. NPDC008343]
MNTVLALQGLQEDVKDLATPGIWGMGSMVSYYSSCSTTCRPA